MGFLDKLKDLLKKKEDAGEEKVNEVLEESDGSAKEEKQSEFDNAVDKSRLFEILNSANVNFNELALDKIQGEADTIASYVRSLLKDLDVYSDKNRDMAIKAIGGKIKHITIHSLELKNLLASLEDRYYVPVIETLKKVNEEAKSKDVSDMIEGLEKDRGLVAALDSSITRVVGYNGLFNPEKNQKYAEEIEKEAKKRLVHGHLSELLDAILAAVTDRVSSVKTRIEKQNPLESAKRFI